MDVSKYRDLLDEIRRISEEPPKTEIERMTKDLQCYILFRAVAVYECTLKTEDNIGISYFVDFIDEFEQALDIRKRLIDLTIIL